MNIKIQSDKIETITVKHKTVIIDDFVEVKEVYTNGVLQKQEWRTIQGFKKTHPEAYEPKLMYFDYYDDISFLESPLCIDHQDIPNSIHVTHWSVFKGLDHVLCIHLGMDGCIYQINKPEAIPIWRMKDYIAGFCNNEFNLKEVIRKLKTKNWIRNIQIIDIPSYNRHDGATEAIVFEYKLGSPKELITKLKQMYPSKYFG